MNRMNKHDLTLPAFAKKDASGELLVQATWREDKHSIFASTSTHIVKIQSWLEISLPSMSKFRIDALLMYTQILNECERTKRKAGIINLN